ncbi:MAG: YlmC/YmxH family sporulation protein [Bacilli bacterium]|nr:YlmC/YmxH family sporulation protein [Bacilli bacterium]
MMKLSELQRKNIINIRDGKIVGKIVDVEVDTNSGLLIKLIIEKAHLVRNIFSSEEDITIKFTQIKKLGEDVILIDLN